MKKILVTDHNMKLYQMTVKALQDYYEILPLPTSTELELYLKNNPTDLILVTVSDIQDEGWKIYDLIKSRQEISDIPVIFLAEHNKPELERKALSFGASEFLTFQVTQELLLLRINNCLEFTKLRKEKPYMVKIQDAISTSFAELVECRDETTGGHLKNTTRYFNVLLKAAMASDTYKDRISPEEVDDLLRSASLHDIGKIGITDDILHKESSLDYHEFEFMKTHTTLGKQTFEKIIKETGGTRWLYLAMDMANCHHERWDGTGYPNGLKGEEIPLYARMLTIADVYDALTSNRAYKKAFSHQVAMGIILEGKGSYFDPALVDLLISINQQFEELLPYNKEVLIQ